MDNQTNKRKNYTEEDFQWTVCCMLVGRNGMRTELFCCACWELCRSGCAASRVSQSTKQTGSSFLHLCFTLLVVDLLCEWRSLISAGFECVGSTLHVTRCDMWQWTVCRWRQRLCCDCRECLEALIECLLCVVVFERVCIWLPLSWCHALDQRRGYKVWYGRSVMICVCMLKGCLKGL